MRRKVGRQRSPASHLTLKAFTLHAVGAGRLRREESRSQFVKLFPKAEHNVAGFGGITDSDWDDGWEDEDDNDGLLG